MLFRNLFERDASRGNRNKRSREARKAAFRCETMRRLRLETLEHRHMLSGLFAPAVNYGVGGWPASVSVDDFNGDSRSDLATANS